ncbi:MAG TPA: hypothetical protein VKD67_01960 [Acidimicrobiales bacterium]|nr:hypothetical protein [Acidimicrobiales bacterium]
MSTSPHEYRRPMLLNAARDLIKKARSERRDRAVFDRHRREAPPFRAGYLETEAPLAAAMTADEPPRHLALPDSSAVV